jgi:CheY-like chemotaxis protein
VLAVDDTATAREILSIQLTRLGFHHQIATCGAEALTALRTAHASGQPFDIAIIDKLMPEMDGETLGRTILADADLATTRLILITASPLPGDARRAESEGFSAFLTKPVREHQLLNTLATVLAPKSAGNAAPILTSNNTPRQIAPRSARILVTEDNRVNQVVAQGLLKTLGLTQVDIANNGREALEALATRHYDLVLMDCQMPVMDGFEATTTLRARGDRVPVIAMTANAMQGDREACLAVGMDDYIAKPMTRDQLETVLTRWLPTA